MTSKPRILIIEDEAAIRTGLMDVFVFHGFDVDWAADGRDGHEKARGGQYDLILLDIMLPGMNGFEICEAIRRNDREQAIIMLTARNTDEDIINGLSLGADDYIAKPFSIAQLVLRVQAVLRRTLGQRDNQEIIRLTNQLELNLTHLKGQNGDEEVHFTRRECDLLRYLAENNDRPISREELLHKVWGYARHLEIETRTVDIHIAKLRRKIEDDPKNPRHLLTIRGAGYRLLVQQ